MVSWYTSAIPRLTKMILTEQYERAWVSSLQWKTCKPVCNKMTGCKPRIARCARTEGSKSVIELTWKFSVAQRLRSSAQIEGDRIRRERGAKKNARFHRITWWRVLSTQRKPPEVRICKLSIQSAVGNRPPSTSTLHWPAC